MSYDDKKLVTLLESTLNPNLRKQAEDELGLVIPFFIPSFVYVFQLLTSSLHSTDSQRSRL